MAVGLGRTIGSPVFLLFQIIHGVSLFFVMLGVSRVLLGMAELTSITASGGTATTTGTRAALLIPNLLPATVDSFDLPASAALQQPTLFPNRASADKVKTLAETTTNTAVQGLSDVAPSFSVQLSYCFHVPLLSLFHGPVPIYSKHLERNAEQQRFGLHMLAALPTTTTASTPTTRPPLRYDGSPSRFYLQHLFAGVLCSYPLAMLLQRRKFVLDFVATIYVAYWVLTDLMLQAVLGGGTLHWWGACLVGFVTMYGATYAICGRTEMQEVKLSGAAAVNTTITTTTTTRSVSPVPAGGATWLRDSRGEEAREMEEVRPGLPDGFGLGGASGGGGAAAAVGVASSGVVGGGSRGRSGTGTASPKPIAVDMSKLDDDQVKSKSV